MASTINIEISLPVYSLLVVHFDGLPSTKTLSKFISSLKFSMSSIRTDGTFMEIDFGEHLNVSLSTLLRSLYFDLCVAALLMQPFSK